MAESGYKTPRWVKVLGSIALLLVVAFAILHLTGGGFRHHGMPSGGMSHPGVSGP